MESEKQCKKRFWRKEEDKILIDYIKVHGEGRWNHVAKNTGLRRCGKSCRLRWLNYLSPSAKRGHFTKEEEDLIIRLHNLHGNRWSLIAKRMPGRTDNEVKNYWRNHLTKKLAADKDKNGRIQEQSRSVAVSSPTNSIRGSKNSSFSSDECVNTSKTTEITIDKSIHEEANDYQVSDTHENDLSFFKGFYYDSSFWFYDDTIKNELLHGYYFDHP